MHPTVNQHETTQSEPLQPERKNPSAAFGAILRKKRVTAGISQETLGHAIGVTFQQVQKYESGANRISLPRAVQMADAIGFNPRELFDVDAEADKAAAVTAKPTRKHLEMAALLATFNDDELVAFKHFAKALGRNA